MVSRGAVPQAMKAISLEVKTIAGTAASMATNLVPNALNSTDQVHLRLDR